MIHTARTVRTLQAVAMTVGTALLLWSTGLPTLFHFAEAASITNASDTISNSAPGLGSDHDIEFITPNGLIIGQTIELTFPTGVNEFVMGAVGENDIDILVNGLSSTTGAVAAAGVWGVTVSGGVITFETPTDSGVASATPIRILIGDNATGGAGNDQITNPSATTSHAIEIGGTMQDSGQVRVAILNQVTVTANVNTSLTFTVSGVANGQTVNGSPTTTSTTTTSTALPFETLSINTSKTLAQDLTITTNAANGYTVTVEQTGELQSTTGATINGFINGAYTTTPVAWEPPSALVDLPDTYGHWGLTSSDTNIIARSGPGQFGSDEWVSGSTTPIAIMGHDDPVLATTTRVGYQIEISALQEAGNDYSTTLRYIATPTF